MRNQRKITKNLSRNFLVFLVITYLCILFPFRSATIFPSLPLFIFSHTTIWTCRYLYLIQTNFLPSKNKLGIFENSNPSFNNSKIIVDYRSYILRQSNNKSFLNDFHFYNKLNMPFFILLSLLFTYKSKHNTPK